jgi:putative toxin-antitoxin system antitoxin component (TIGR02293 family)
MAKTRPGSQKAGKTTAKRAAGASRTLRAGRHKASTSRPKPAEPTRYSAPAAPPLERYLEPEFYATAPDPAWIGEIAASDATVRMDLVRHGVPAQAVAALAEALDMSRDELTRALGLPRSTVERKLRDGGHLGQAESERVLGVVRLIGQVRRIVQESGDPTGFDAPLWVAHWLQAPVPALGGRPPMQFMDTAEGRAVVSQLVEQMQSGAYA